MTQNRMMNSIRDGPRDQPRASAKQVREEAAGPAGRATEAGRFPRDARAPARAGVPHGDIWEQPGCLLESDSPESTAARAIKYGRTPCCASARTFCGRQGLARSGLRAPPPWKVCYPWACCCSAETQGSPPRLAVCFTASADSSHILS